MSRVPTVSRNISTDCASASCRSVNRSILSSIVISKRSPFSVSPTGQVGDSGALWRIDPPRKEHSCCLNVWCGAGANLSVEYSTMAGTIGNIRRRRGRDARHFEQQSEDHQRNKREPHIEQNALHQRPFPPVPIV